VDRYELCREQDAFSERLSLDTFFKDNAWHVRVMGFDRKRRVPTFQLLPGGKSQKATLPMLRAAVERYKAEGWLDELQDDAKQRIAVRVAAEEAAEAAREAKKRAALAAKRKSTAKKPGARQAKRRTSR
jgi:hypothetical protein